jgi:hypothetical protein
MVELVGLNCLVNRFEVPGAGLFLLLGKVRRSGRVGLGDNNSRQENPEAGPRQVVCQAAHHIKRLCSVFIVTDCGVAK